MSSKFKKTYAALMLFLIIILKTSQALAEAASGNTTMNSDTVVRWIFAGVIALFLIIIAVLSKAVKVAAGIYQKKIRSEKAKGSKIISIILLCTLFSQHVFAAATENVTGNNSFSNLDIYLFIIIVILLFVVVLTLVKALFVLMGIKKINQANTNASTGKVRTWFQKLNETVPIEEEASLDMSHDYDGIRELDNKIPSWWTWAFISSVLFGIIYLYRMFGSETLPNQYVELSQANEIAAEAKLEYLKKGANNVDENTVKMLGDAEIAEGAGLYAKNCVACHGAFGQGGVGPNLTDDYWLHKGGIKDIFYTIKYGWAEKGMKSWKEDFSPGQIAQLASFVHTLHGTNPLTPKEKQGELYSDDKLTAGIDSTKNEVPDTNKVNKKESIH